MTEPRTPVDIERVFRKVPAVLLVLLPDDRFTMVEATDARLEATMTRREDIIGRGLFDVFPDNPDDPEATGVRNLAASLRRAMASGETDVMPVQKYDIPRPPEQGGGFEERYWSPQNTPVLDDNRKVIYLIHRVEDVTAAVLAGRAEKKARKDLRDAEYRYRAVVEHVPAITYTATVTDPIRILYVSPQISELGIEPEEWQEDPDIFWRYVHPDDVPATAKAWRTFRREGGRFDQEFRFIRDDGSAVWLRGQAAIVRDEEGPDFVQGIGTDISDYKRAEAELRAHRDRLEDLAAERTEALQVANRRLADDVRRRQRAERALFAEKQRVEITLNAIADAVVAIDAKGRIDYLNPAAETMLHTTEAKARGRTLVDVLPSGALSDEERERLLKVTARGERMETELRVMRGDGKQHIISLSSTPITDNHRRLEGAVVVLEDVTEQRLHHERLAYRARHDALTGLPNREEFETRLRHAIDSIEQQDAQHVLLFIDLDGFKCVNDNGGHAAGDELLRQLPSVMTRHVRGRDTLARIGGDEFACLLEHCSLDQGTDIARAMLAAVRDYSLHWNGREFSVGASVGIVPLDQPGIDMADAMQAGDAACYAVKAGGKNNVGVQRPGELEEPAVQQDGLDRLVAALGEDRFELVVQPIQQLADGEVHAFEVLLRLVDGERRIAAAAFMPLAERHRLASEIDRWVIRNTFALLAAQDNAPVHYINVSSGALAERQLIDHIEDQLAAYDLAPEKVGFEINEKDLMTQFNESHEFATAMKSLGCHVALDGFAYGFALTRRLENQRYDLVKISERLLTGAQADHITQTLLDSANRLGHALGSATVAKCPRSDAELQLVRRLGFDYVQGDLVGYPQRAGSAHLATR